MEHDDPLWISRYIANVKGKIVFIDQGSLTGILLKDVFDKLELPISDRLRSDKEKIDFSGKNAKLEWYLTLRDKNLISNSLSKISHGRLSLHLISWVLWFPLPCL